MCAAIARSTVDRFDSESIQGKCATIKRYRLPDSDLVTTIPTGLPMSRSNVQDHIDGPSVAEFHMTTDEIILFRS